MRKERGIAAIAALAISAGMIAGVSVFASNALTIGQSAQTSVLNSTTTTVDSLIAVSEGAANENYALLAGSVMGKTAAKTITAADKKIKADIKAEAEAKKKAKEEAAKKKAKEEAAKKAKEEEEKKKAEEEAARKAAAKTSWNGGSLTASAGVFYGPSGKETYYNLDMGGVINIMRNMGFSESEYEYWVRDDGCKMFGDYIMVACNLDIRPRGSLIETSLGTGIVCDTSPVFVGDNATQIDVAVTW
ncbi:MAG: hypothetical protein J6O40_07980 [Ruminococcus sp.]|nr:hypothetical protein [Ruminococcus sp.]